MSAKVHLHMHVSDLGKSRDFYERFLGADPVKVKTGYVKFLPDWAPVNLALSEGGHAAEGYAKASGKVGVAFATSGPGAINLVVGLATAQMDSAPLVVIWFERRVIARMQQRPGPKLVEPSRAGQSFDSLEDDRGQAGGDGRPETVEPQVLDDAVAEERAGRSRDPLNEVVPPDLGGERDARLELLLGFHEALGRSVEFRDRLLHRLLEPDREGKEILVHVEERGGSVLSDDLEERFEQAERGVEHVADQLRAEGQLAAPVRGARRHPVRDHQSGGGRRRGNRSGPDCRRRTAGNQDRAAASGEDLAVPHADDECVRDAADSRVEIVVIILGRESTHGRVREG